MSGGRQDSIPARFYGYKEDTSLFVSGLSPFQTISCFLVAAVKPT